jgi:hypothetical protein
VDSGAADVGGTAGATGGAAGADASVADGGAEANRDVAAVPLPGSVTWAIDNLQSIGGQPTTVVGAPMVIDTPAGKAVQFNGVADALFVDKQPLAGFSAFTVELIFRPDTGGAAEQRFFHMQANGSDDRVLFEMRLNGNSWFFVSFAQSGTAIGRLYAAAFPHPVGPWYHLAIVVDGTTMRHYVNGVYENAAPCAATESPTCTGKLMAPFPLAYRPIGPGTTSLGVRITRTAWLKGAMRLARFTPRALTPAEFLPLP